MKKLLKVLFFLSAFQSAQAQSFNPLLAAMLQDTLDTYVSLSSNVKGMSASVYLPGQGIWQGVSGVSYAGQPITSDMNFGIASNTKLFVATGMLKLAENNIISLDDSISRWLASYANVDPNITIRQLLNHTSGVSDPIFYSPWMDTIKAHPTRVFTPTEVLSWLGAPLFARGTSWGYSNVNYILAGMIAQSATGFHISKIIRDSILTPLNMDSTFYDVEESDFGVISHRWWNGVDYNDTSRVGLNSAGGAAGSIFSNASEMAQWYHALFSGQILSQSSLDQLTNFVPTTSATLDYGLGLDREVTLGMPYWGHGGSTWGYRSKMVYDSCLQAVVCGLTNCYPSGMEGITFLLYRVVKNHVPGCSDAISGPINICQGQQSVTYLVSSIPNATSYTWTLPSGTTGSSNTNLIVVNFDSTAVSGNIVVSGVNMYGAGGTSSLYVNVNPIPTTPVITQNLNVLTSSSATGNQWYDSNGLIVGATNQNYTVTTDGTYYVIVSLLGCTSNESNSIDVVLTGIQMEENNQLIKVHPNPTSSILFLSERCNIKLTDITGKVLLENQNINSIDLSNQPKGIYYILISKENGKQIQRNKIVKN